MHVIAEALAERVLQVFEPVACFHIDTRVRVDVEERSAASVVRQPVDGADEYVDMFAGGRRVQCAGKRFLFGRGCAKGPASLMPS